MSIPPRGVDELSEAVIALAAAPRGTQLERARELAETWPALVSEEAWNTRFDPGSVFEAWTSTEVVSGVYRANAEALDALQPGWRVIEVGGGDGRLWRHVQARRVLPPGQLVVVDPLAEVHDQVRSALPAHVEVVHEVAMVQDVLASLPEADAIVCSLTLHHVAGRSAAERARHGLAGPGKGEVLTAFREALAPRRGMCLVNEADVYCDVGLAPGDPVLVEHMLDGYVRRCGLSLAHQIRRTPAPTDTTGLRARWAAILHRWCLGQLAHADAPLAERDVYELDVARWRHVFDAAGFEVVHEGFTDEYRLFCRYHLVPR